MKQERIASAWKRGGVFALSAAILAGAGSAAYIAIPLTPDAIYVAKAPESVLPEKPKALHVKTPEPLYAIYMSQCVVGTPSFRESLASFIEHSSLNAVVIDIKDYTGGIAFPTDNPILKESVSDACGARDMRVFIERLHASGIYVIGRITVFQSPLHTKLHPEWAIKTVSDPNVVWKDYKGLSFIDVGARPYWDWIIELSKESYELGFDELNYDYIRYPSDGPISEVNALLSEGKDKEVMLEEFFAYLASRVGPMGAVLSADLFGMTTTNTDDLNIGQVLERALPYFDYIAPMVYPSHYPKSFLGLGNPNSDPYRVVHYSLAESVKRLVATTTSVTVGPAVASTTPTRYAKPVYSLAKIRPWLQDFDYGKDYRPEDIEAQIRATGDAGLSSWMFWDPANRYDNLRSVLATSTPQN